MGVLASQDDFLLEVYSDYRVVNGFVFEVLVIVSNFCLSGWVVTVDR